MPRVTYFYRGGEPAGSALQCLLHKPCAVGHLAKCWPAAVGCQISGQRPDDGTDTRRINRDDGLRRAAGGLRRQGSQGLQFATLPSLGDRVRDTDHHSLQCWPLAQIVLAGVGADRPFLLAAHKGCSAKTDAPELGSGSLTHGCETFSGWVGIAIAADAQWPRINHRDRDRGSDISKHAKCTGRHAGLWCVGSRIRCRD
jgi:hypothetical protein